MATEADRDGGAVAKPAATILPFGKKTTPVRIILDQDSRTEAGRRDAALSACDWRPDDLRRAVAGAQLAAEDRDGLRRFEFDDGSAIVVCGARYREYHVGFHRSECENRTLLEALARLSGQTAEFARKTARFACPTTLEAANPEVVFIDPPALVASMDLASQQAAGERGRQPAIKLAFDTSLSTSASELDEVLSAVEWTSDDLAAHLADARISAERADGLRRFEFDDGSAIVVRPGENGARDEYHVGLERSDCESDHIARALATVLGQTVADVRQTLKFADPIELEERHSMIALVNPPPIQVATDIGQDRSSERDAGWSL